MFLMRSPLYDTWTKKALIGALLFAKKKIPLAGNISEIILAYIPHYRKIYAYIWSK